MIDNISTSRPFYVHDHLNTYFNISPQIDRSPYVSLNVELAPNDVALRIPRTTVWLAPATEDTYSRARLEIADTEKAREPGKRQAGASAPLLRALAEGNWAAF